MCPPESRYSSEGTSWFFNWGRMPFLTLKPALFYAILDDWVRPGAAADKQVGAATRKVIGSGSLAISPFLAVLWG